MCFYISRSSICFVFVFVLFCFIFTVSIFLLCLSSCFFHSWNCWYYLFWNLLSFFYISSLEIKRLPLVATRAPCRERGRGKVRWLPWTVLHGRDCEFHIARGRAKHQSRKQRRKMAEKQQLTFTSPSFKIKTELYPLTPSSEVLSPISSATDHHESPGESDQMLPKLLLILTGTETEGSEHD